MRRGSCSNIDCKTHEQNGEKFSFGFFLKKKLMSVFAQISYIWHFRGVASYSVLSGFGFTWVYSTLHDMQPCICSVLEQLHQLVKFYIVTLFAQTYLDRY